MQTWTATRTLKLNNTAALISKTEQVKHLKIQCFIYTVKKKPREHGEMDDYTVIVKTTLVCCSSEVCVWDDIC